MSSDPTSITRLFDAAFTLAAERGWAQADFRAAAAQANLSLAEAFELCPGKTALLTAYARHLNQETLGIEAAEDETASMQERLFDAIMRRFDAMLPHRAGLRAVHRDILRDPILSLQLLPTVGPALDALILVAGGDWSGLSGLRRRIGLARVLYGVHKLWLEDDDPGQARPMAELDRRLRDLAVDDGQRPRTGAQEAPSNDEP